MFEDLAKWLEGLGLGEYADAFAENAVDFRTVTALTEDDLKELGLKIGHRRLLQKAVADLSASDRPTDGSDTDTESNRIPT